MRAPTCTEHGYSLCECDCGVSYEGDQTAARGHAWVDRTIFGQSSLVCTSALECNRCGESITLERHAFTYTGSVVPPTCTEEAYYPESCECGFVHNHVVSNAIGHNYTSTVVAPTETTYGYTQYTCSACGHSYKDNFVNHEHSYDTVTVVAPTCTENGYTLHECECGHSYEDTETELLGHAIRGFTAGEEPPALSRYTCTRCDFSYTLQHSKTYSLRGRSQRILESTTVEEYSYVYTGGNLMQMVLKTTTTPAGGTATTTTETLNFTYDASGTPMSVNFSGTDYYYVANIQGDIMAILNTAGSAVVEYTYDAWGKLYSTNGTLADTLGEVNPLTYRGYVYDREIGMFYLQSRYYDPEIGRFINADDYVSAGNNLLSKNTFAYCNNNPVVLADKTGEFPWLIVGLVVAVVAIIGVDHMVAANQPEGGYIVANETNSKGARKKGLFIKGNGFEINENEVIICDVETGLVSMSVETDCADVEIVDCLTASATAQVDWSGHMPEVDISAVASIYSPSAEVTIPFGFFEVTISGDLYIGALGVGLELDPDSGRIKITPPIRGIGYSLGLDFDLT